MNRQNLESYKGLLNPKTLSRQSIQILKDLSVYFELHECHKAEVDEFATFFFNVRNPYIDDKTVTEYKEIFRLLGELDAKESIETLIKGFKQQNLYEDLKRGIDQNQELDELLHKIEQFNQEHNKESLDNIFMDMDIEEAAEFTDRSKGLKWRCKALQDYFEGGVIKSDFIIIAGGIGAGKSSFIASELSFMGEQLKDDEYILWLSNEGSYKTALTRLYSAALNSSWKQIRQYMPSAKEKYLKLMNGDKNRIRIVDIQGWSAKQIENVIKKRTPALTVIDLVDNIEGFDKYSTKENSFEKYGKLYQWCREVATQYCPVLGVSQFSIEGQDAMYPKMTSLRGSKIDKAGACTALLTIGSVAGDNTTRYLGMPKSKVRSDVMDWRATVSFDAEKSRYT